MKHLQFLNTQMASTKKSKKEEEWKKTKESEAKSPKTPIKKTPSKSPKKQKHENSNSKKSPNVKVKESPQVSIISSSSSGSLEEVVTKKTKPKNQSSNCKSPKTEKSKKIKLKEEDDTEEGQDGTMCIFGMSRIRRIMKTGDTGSKLPQDVVFLVNKATEMFIEQFCEEAYKYSAREQKESIAYKQLSSVVSQQRRFDFLSDFVPKQLRAKEALARIKPTETAQR